MDTSVTGAGGQPPSAAAVVALKVVADAKSRLGSLPDPLRRRLAWTMALDTLAALAAALDDVLVVSDQPALASRLARGGVRARVVGEAGAAGMNGALSRGAALLRQDGHRTVLACVGDLPALQPGTVSGVLAASPVPGRSFLPDASGTGTTMLVARDVDLDPRFQGLSATAHEESGALRLTEERVGAPLADGRQDVDTEAELAPAVALGVGPATRALLEGPGGTLAAYTVITTTSHSDDQGRALVVAASGHRLALPRAALADGLRDLRPGQRLHSVQSAGVVRSAWL